MNETVKYPIKPPVQPPKSVIFQERPVKGMGLWGIHDPAIYKDEEQKQYYIYSTGGFCYESPDLIHWKIVGKVVETPPKESYDWTKSEDIWAPDIIKEGKEYRLYCSNSSWGVRQSCIFLAVADNPKGPFKPRGCVLKTSDSLPVNAIDANIITDIKTNEQYLVYGSFWGGCHILLLNRETGLAKEQGIGTCIACRPTWMSAGIEGPYMIYNSANQYYYLFVSYGSLKSDYHIRVGRSRNIKGPFLDQNGRNLTDLTDSDNTVGYLLLSGYRWKDGMPYMAPGHNSVLCDKDGSWYLVYHIRELNYGSNEEPSTMQIRKLYWTEDGWPVASAECYAGEKEQVISRETIVGNYERITFVPSLPQGVQMSLPMKLRNDGYYECCSIQGSWEYKNHVLTIKYGPHCETLHVSACWDFERDQHSIQCCGTNEHGIAMCAKRVSDI